MKRLVVSGLGAAVGLPSDPGPFLRARKMRKFMSPADDLAVVAAGRAIGEAGILGRVRPERIGLYMAVGYIPFERADMDAILENSLRDGRFDMGRFSTEGFDAADPLLTFRCLTNMPAFHVSVNFDVQGPYLVTYPGPGAFYAALAEAAVAIEDGRVDAALLLGSAHQRNFLVEHLLSRLDPPTPASRLRDGAGCVILEREAAPPGPGGGAESRPRSPSEGGEAPTGPGPIEAPARRGRLISFSTSYRAHDPLSESISPEESFEGATVPEGDFGAASLPVAISSARGGRLVHRLRGRDGVEAESAWEIA